MRISRLLAFILFVAINGLAMPVGAADPVPASAQPASDTGVQVGGYYVQPSVDLLKRLGIISGDPDGRMRLGDTITRAELVKVVVVAMGKSAEALKAQADPPAFPDVKDHWARGYIATAKQQGITGGYEDGSFRPGNPVTHAEAVTMLLRANGQKLAGPWPQAYLDAARRVGVLTESLDRALPASQQANRAAVFLLADRSFTRIADAAGHSLLQRVFRLSAAPRIGVIVQGAETGVTRLAEVNLSIRAQGAVLVQVSGRPAWPGGGFFTLKVPLVLGQNVFQILAADELGNQTTERLTITRQP